MTSTAPTASINAFDPADVAIPRLLEAHGGKMLALAQRMCDDPHQAEDLVQETFLQAYRKWDQFEGRSSPETWLYTVAARLCYRMHRRRAGEPKHIASLQQLSPFDERTMPSLPAEGDSPLQKQLRVEVREQIEAAIVTLPAIFRLPLVLKEIIGLPVQEVAQILSLKEATVKTRLHRARHVLRKALSEALPGREATKPAYPIRVCLDLMRAKQAALDNNAAFPIEQKDFCERCRAIFTAMDISHEVCEQLGDRELPPGLRQAVLEDIARESGH